MSPMKLNLASHKSFALRIPQLVRSRSERIKRSNSTWKEFSACRKNFQNTAPSSCNQSVVKSKKLVDLYEAYLEARLREVHAQYILARNILARNILADETLTSSLLKQVLAYKGKLHRHMYALMAKLSQLKKRKAALAESLTDLSGGELESWIQTFLARPVAEITH